MFTRNGIWEEGEWREVGVGSEVAFLAFEGRLPIRFEKLTKQCESANRIWQYALRTPYPVRNKRDTGYRVPCRGGGRVDLQILVTS